jgi:hypothetical protein
MKSLVAIVPNCRSAYVASPVSDGNKIVEIDLEPVVAWKIVYKEDAPNEFSDIATGIPVTIHSGLPGDYAIYYSDTELWSVAEDTSGKGMDSLLKHFQERENRRNG